MKNSFPQLLKGSLLLVISIILVNTIRVDAEETVMSQPVCLPNRNLYNISWDKNKNIGVNINNVSSLTQEQIESGYIGGIQTEANKFEAILLSTSCYKEGNTIYTCPSDKEKSKYAVNHYLDTDDGKTYKNITAELDINSGKYNIKIKDLFNGKLKVRVVYNKNDANTDGVNSATAYSNFLTKQGGYYVINGVNPSSFDGSSFRNNTMILEFYVNDSSSKCNNSFVATLDYVVPIMDDSIELDNPALTDSSYGCDSVKTYINNLVSNGNIPNNSDVLTSIKTNYVSYCYQSKVTYKEYRELKNNINKQYTDLKALLTSGADSAQSPFKISNGLVCNNGASTGERTVIADSGKWWSLTCKESYTAVGDRPKLVYAGAGFTYVSTFTATRTCTLRQNAQVVLKPQCHYSCETTCTYSESAGTVTDNKGGPNEDFDACVNTCDGGKYTQSCINSCYEKVYGTDRELPLTDKNKKVSFLDDGYQIQRTASNIYTITNHNDYSSTFTGMTTDGAGRPKAMYRVDVPTKHCGTVGVTFSSYCDGHDGQCSVYESVGPSGCVDNPQELYASELNESQSEYSSMIDKMSKEIGSGSYSLKIADSYLNNGGTAYTYELSTDNGDSITTVEKGGGCSNSRTWTLGSQGETVSGCENNVTTKKVTVSLVPAYLDKKSGMSIYETKSNRYMKFNATTASTKLESTSFNSKNVYPGGNRYYTNILSDNVNVVIPKTGAITLTDSGTAFNGNKALIKVSVDGLGTDGGYTNDIDCYYGVYNNTICKDGTCNQCTGPGCPDGNGGKNDSKGNTGNGITIIYRPIDLTDNFPNNRNPRWNWTSSASRNLDQFLNYKIDPVGLNQAIENKGYDIYNRSDEVDYNFILTPQNIRAIRKYNKSVDDLNADGERNYLDYDLDCISRKGRDYCTSKFMDNTNYVTYADGFNSVMRQDIAKCNNAKGGSSCDD